MKSVYGTSLTVLLVHLTELHLVYSNANTMYSLNTLKNGNIYFFTVHKASSIEVTKNDRRVAVDYIDPVSSRFLNISISKGWKVTSTSEEFSLFSHFLCSTTEERILFVQPLLLSISFRQPSTLMKSCHAKSGQSHTLLPVLSRLQN